MRRLRTAKLRRASSRRAPAAKGEAASPATVSSHILPTSATLVGGCLTALSLVKFTHFGVIGVFLDRLLGLGTCLLFASTLASFISMRLNVLSERFEYAAEVLFLFALILVAIAAFALAFEIS